MRFEGKLKSWNDERGFGFIEIRDGQDIFVHIKDFERNVARPDLGQTLSFELELNPQGKKRAVRVQAVRPTKLSKSRSNDAPARWGTASYFAIPCFLLLYLSTAII